MPVVNHHGKCLPEYLRVHNFVEFGCELGLLFKDDSHSVHRLEAKVHELGLLVLHGEDDDQHDVLECLLVQCEKALGAVLDHIHH